MKSGLEAPQSIADDRLSTRERRWRDDMAHRKRSPQPPQPPTRGEDGDTLTAADEKILDKVWATVTDEEIAASMKWYDEIDQQNAKAKKAKGEGK